MKKNKLIAAILCAALLLWGCAEDKAEQFADRTEQFAAITEEETVISSENTVPEIRQSFGQLECLYYNEKEFGAFDGMSRVYETDGELMCMTVPHHLLAGNMISSAFRTAAERESTDTVVIVAPIHEPRGDDIVTSLADWITPFGVTENDREISELFAERLGAAYDNDMLETDHSASGLIPFAARFFPDAKISCLLVAGRADKDIPRQLSELLCEISAEKNCLFVFSSDFSHYLEPHDADRMDTETRRAVFDGDTAAIAAMTNDNTDSPPTVETFVRLSSLLGCTVSELDHGNSMTVTHLSYTMANFPEGVTSYFIFGAVR